MNLYQIRELLGENRLVGSGLQEVAGFSIDSRTIKPGELFFALPGEKTDGHRFVADALQKGACGAVVSRVPGELSPELLTRAGLLVVADPLEALQQLAGVLRRQAGIPVVAVTGSNGKTTTKDLIASVLGTKYRVLKSQGNFNNEIGLPLTLAQLIHRFDIAVVEMGMRGMGQIRELCRIARPDYGVITNIGVAHFELLGSRENIAAAKGELLESLPDSGVAILNRDDAYSVGLGEKLARERPGLKIMYFGFHPEADVQAKNLALADGGVTFEISAGGVSAEAFLPLYGEHNVQNALAAVAVGLACDLPLTACLDGLRTAAISEKRLAKTPGIRGSFIIDDTYNANPGSTVASLRVLHALPGNRKIAVLGSMKELGSLAEAGHREVGREAARLGVDFLFTLGEEAGWIAQAALDSGLEPARVARCRSKEEVIEQLRVLLKRGDVVLVKGSRALAMEEIVKAVSAVEGGTRD